MAKLGKNELAILLACDDTPRTGMDLGGRAGVIAIPRLADAIRSLLGRNLIGAVDMAPIKYLITDAGRTERDNINNPPMHKSGTDS